MGESRFDGGGAGYCCYGIKPITLGSNVHQTQPGEVGVWGLQCSKQQSKGVVADVVRVESREYGWQLTKSARVFVPVCNNQPRVSIYPINKEHA